MSRRTALAVLLVACAPAPTADATPPRSAAASASPPPPLAPAAPVSLASLPRGGAAYAIVSPALLDELLASFPEAAELRRELLPPAAGSASLTDAFSKLGLSPGASLRVAFVPPDLARAQAVVDALRAGKPAPLDAGKVAAFVRLEWPLAPGASHEPLLEALARWQKGKVLPCPASQACAALAQPPGLRPLALVVGRTALVALRAGPQLVVDVALPVYGDPGDEGLFGALAELGKVTGGPEAPRCAALDGAGLGSLCVDADRVAAWGASLGWGATVRAVSAVEPKHRAAILQAGYKEARRNLELAAPARLLLDDGTVTFSRGAGGLVVRSSWALGESRALVERDLASPRCAPAAQLEGKVLEPLARVLGSPGPDFAKPEERLEHVREAGAAAWPILFARTWPNFLGWALSRPGRVKSPWASGEVCASTDGGRYVLTSTPKP